MTQILTYLNCTNNIVPVDGMKRKSLYTGLCYRMYFLREHNHSLFLKKQNVYRFCKMLVNKVKGRNLLYVFPQIAFFVLLPKQSNLKTTKKGVMLDRRRLSRNILTLCRDNEVAIHTISQSRQFHALTHVIPCQSKFHWTHFSRHGTSFYPSSFNCIQGIIYVETSSPQPISC